MAANDNPALTYIRSKDDSAQIAVAMTNDLHRLCWGRLWTSNEPHPVPVIAVADPEAWVRTQRMIGQMTMAERMAARRAALAPKLAAAA